MIFKKIFKMLAASVNILFIGFVTVLVLNLIEYFCPVLYWIIGIGVLFVVFLPLGRLSGAVFGEGWGEASILHTIKRWQMYACLFTHFFVVFQFFISFFLLAFGVFFVPLRK